MAYVSIPIGGPDELTMPFDPFAASCEEQEWNESRCTVPVQIELSCAGPFIESSTDEWAADDELAKSVGRQPGTSKKRLGIISEERKKLNISQVPDCLSA
ncbi:MAG: hypothetical protein R3C49_13295 [Planctomycetaceae bacterium]